MRVIGQGSISGISRGCYTSSNSGNTLAQRVWFNESFMRLFRVCPDTDESSPRDYNPQEGIALSFIRNVPCLAPNLGYAWVGETMRKKGIDLSFQILPVVLKQETLTELKDKAKSWELRFNPVFLKYASFHVNSSGVKFLKEEEPFEDEDIIVSLELPLSAAQPYYEFEGNTEVLLGIFENYYSRGKGDGYELEHENALCSAIIRMKDKSKISINYTNRYGEGVIIENIVGRKFKFICYGGRLLRLDDFDFQSSFSDFTVDDD